MKPNPGLSFYVAHRQRDSKRWVLGKTTGFMALLWSASPLMQDRIVQRLQFHNRLY